MAYYVTDKKLIDGLNESQIDGLYDQGYVLTRLPQMNQTRSLRINLEEFEQSSENRRILRKVADLDFSYLTLPLEANQTNWRIFAMCNHFYKTKFNDVKFSTNKVRKLLTVYEPDSSKFNGLITYYKNDTAGDSSSSNNFDHSKALGYCIVYKTNHILHYCYPFYDLESDVANLGMGMMLNAVIWAKKQGLKYVYLGSFTRPTDIYKLQFKGLEWWDKDKWSQDLESLKRLI